MSNILTAIGGRHPPHAIIEQRHFHQDVATEKQISIAHKSSASQLKDATKLGSILKRTGGGHLGIAPKLSVPIKTEHNVNNTNQEDLMQKTFKNTSPSASESKATITHKIAIAIIETEYKKRVAKTLRLKNERLAHEASLLATPKKLTSKRSVKKVKTN